MRSHFSTVETALRWAKTLVMSLDAEILLAHAMNKTRSFLHAWPTTVLDELIQENFYLMIQQRQQGKPVAYITSHQEFWSLDLCVTPDVLVPRPETELLVELILKKFSTKGPKNIVDLGTGSGAIALALAKERPEWNIYATDKSSLALEIAKSNAKRLNLLNIIFCQGEWYEALPKLRFDAIISNPPYIAQGDTELNQDVIEFQPHLALFSDEAGLKDLRVIIQEGKNYLRKNGWLLLEHGYQQANDVKDLFVQGGYRDIEVHKDMAGLDRVTSAFFP